MWHKLTRYLLGEDLELIELTVICNVVFIALKGLT